MRTNEHTALSNPTILLVPYGERHVPTYHSWMQDPELQAATASEPLSLDEEYAMQRSWRTDHDKLTFIVCAPLEAAHETNGPVSISSVNVGQDDPAETMMGDINLFLFSPDSSEMEEDIASLGGNVVGEVELMIARTSLRRKGYGRAALLVFLEYVLGNWSVIAEEYARQGQAEGKNVLAPQLSFLRVKVKVTNTGSIRLFESVGFVRTAEEVNYFGEVELRWSPNVESLRTVNGWESATRLRYDG